MPGQIQEDDKMKTADDLRQAGSGRRDEGERSNATEISPEGWANTNGVAADAEQPPRRTSARPSPAAGAREINAREVLIELDSIALSGDLAVPASAKAVVLFAHGSGSSRHSPRNRYVASALQKAGFATLLLDLLTRDEEAVDNRTATVRFDIGLLAKRLTGASWWLVEQHELTDLTIGYFGASTGAAAALLAASGQADLVGAVVSRGGRPDLAGPALERVLSPTLLIVGSRDVELLELNRMALAAMPAMSKKLQLVPAATHLFEEPGALEAVAQAATGWFSRYLAHGKVTQRAA